MLSGVINKKTVTILLTNMVSITKCEYLGKLFSLNLFAYLLNQKSNTQFTECGTSKLSAWNKDPNKEVFFLLSFLSFFSFFSFKYLCIHIYMYIVFLDLVTYFHIFNLLYQTRKYCYVVPNFAYFLIAYYSHIAYYQLCDIFK